jgi:hypothetical protein
MADPVPQPEAIEKLGNAAFFSIAMMAGMQLELFTPLGSGPMTAEQLAKCSVSEIMSWLCCLL